MIDDLDPIKLDFSQNNQTMIVAFGSMALAQKIPPFEWTNVLTNIPTQKAFVRDIHQFWYLKGLPGIADSPVGVGDYLRHLKIEQGCSRTVFVGGSMGGFAALLFGHLAEVDEVHAFSSLTHLPARKGRYLAQAILMRRWGILRKDLELVANRQQYRPFLDLRALLQNSNTHTQYHLYYSTDNTKDTLHAQHLDRLPNVHLHARNLGEGHRVGVAMRNSGELETVLQKAIRLA